MEKNMESLQSRQESWRLFRPVRRFSNHEAGWQMEKCLRQGDSDDSDEWATDGYRWLQMATDGYRWLQMATVDVLKIWLWFLCGFQRSFSRCVADLQ